MGNFNMLIECKNKWSGQVRSDQVRSDQVRSGQVRSGQVSYLQLTISSGTKNMDVQYLGDLTFCGSKIQEAAAACGRW
jgi:hypothetical protein